MTAQPGLVKLVILLAGFRIAEVELIGLVFRWAVSFERQIASLADLAGVRSLRHFGKFGRLICCSELLERFDRISRAS